MNGDDRPETESTEIGADYSTLATLNRAEIDQQIATAKKFPRSITGFHKRALELVQLTAETAAQCIYALPRGGKIIKGPSARLAEIVAHCWGNCRAGARATGEEAEFVVAQGAFYDLEANVAISFEVKRRIVTKNGQRYDSDMIGVTSNAACSIALRNAVLKGVPKALWEPLYLAAERMIRGDEKTLAQRRQALLEYFGKLKIKPEQIFVALGVKGIEDIGLDELVTLRGVATAIEEGDTTPEQAFRGAQERIQQPKRASEAGKTQETAARPEDSAAKAATKLEESQPEAKKSKKSPQEPPKAKSEPINEKQRGKLYSLAAAAGYSTAEDIRKRVLEVCKKFGFASAGEVEKDRYEEVCAELWTSKEKA